MTQGARLIQRLARIAPELGPLYEQHLARNYGQTLPHVLLGEVTFFVAHEALERRKRPLLTRILAFLEEELGGPDADARDVIIASFAENLLGEEDAVSELLPMMGPRLTKAVEEVCGHSAGRP